MPSGFVAALEAADISVSGHTLLRNISLCLKAGSLNVIYGPGACGKSALLSVFWGALRPDRGTVFCRGWDMTHASSRLWSAWRRQVGIFCSDFPLLNQETVFANVAAALRVVDRLPQEVIVDRTNRELAQWGLLNARHAPARLLARGERARLALARVFVRRPVAAFLDEPLANVSGSEREEAWGIIRRQAISGTAILAATSIMHNLNLVADHLYEIDGGQLNLPIRSSAMETA